MITIKRFSPTSIQLTGRTQRPADVMIKNDGGIRLSVESHGTGYDQPIDQLLVSVGRAPNVDNMNLEAVGVDFHKKGVTVNDRMQTTNPMIYAVGDVCSPFQFTHAADCTRAADSRATCVRQGASRTQDLVGTGEGCLPGVHQLVGMGANPSHVLTTASFSNRG